MNRRPGKALALSSDAASRARVLLLARRVLTPSGCWEYDGCTDGTGYGRLWFGGTQIRAHKLAVAAWHGPIPAGVDILHSCDNPPCFNPAHVRPGTVSENLSEAYERGRRDNGREWPDEPPF